MISVIFFVFMAFAAGDMYVIRYPVPDTMRGTIYMPLDTIFVEDSFTLLSTNMGYIKRGTPFANDSVIEEFLKEMYLHLIKNTQDVIIQHFIRISIIGEVRQPTLSYVEAKMPISSVISLAGGPTERANLKKIKIYSRGKYMKLNFYEATRNALTFEDIGLASGDVIEIPKKLYINFSNISAAISAIILLWSFYQTNFK